MLTLGSLGWITVQRDLQFDYDLDNSPLQIRTNSVIGGNDEIRISLYSAIGHFAGGADLFFTSPPQYWLSHCTSISKSDFLTDLPPETDKIWRINLTRNSGVPRLVVHCNNKEVLNQVISGTTCGDISWSIYWNRDVEKINFHSADTASDYYRAGKDGKLV